MLTMKQNYDRLDKLQGKGWPGSKSIHPGKSVSKAVEQFKVKPPMDTGE